MGRLIAITLAAVVFAGCHQQTEPPSPPGPKIEGERVIFPAASPQLASIASEEIVVRPEPSLRLNGRLAWDEDRTVRVYTPFAGRVERIMVQPGETVRRGQSLATVASPDFGQAQTDARRAETDYALAAKNLERMRELDEHGVIARKEVQVTEAEFQRAEAERARNRARLALYGASGRAVDQTFTLASPIAGTLVERNINPGQELRPDQMGAAPPLFLVTDPTTLWALIDVHEKDLPQLKLGKAVTLRSPAYPSVEFAARIAMVTDFLDPATRTLKVRAVVPNPKRTLKAEMFVTADVAIEGASVLQVPEKPVFFQGGKHYLFVDEGNGAYRRHEVQVGEIHEGLVHISSGLADRSRVVTEGSLFLQQVLAPRRVQN
jgi:cobalt-zinc-cadmium efflux system membrane fusion protein